MADVRISDPATRVNAPAADGPGAPSRMILAGWRYNKNITSKELQDISDSVTLGLLRRLSLQSNHFFRNEQRYYEVAVSEAIAEITGG